MHSPLLPSDGMDPLTLLRDEHGHILKQVYATDNRLTWLESSGPEKSARILSSFERDIRRICNSLSLHFYREEKVLFPALKKRLGYDTNPVHVMKHEHQELLKHLTSLRSEIGRVPEEGNVIRTWDLTSKLQNLKVGLSDHVSREESVLYWLAELRLSGLDRRKIFFDLVQITHIPSPVGERLVKSNLSVP